jgi:PAS domain S-box-containing protein
MRVPPTTLPDERPVGVVLQEPFRLLVESVKDYAIFMLNPDGCVATWNLGAERIKGYAAGEIIGRHFSAFYPPEAVAAGTCDLELEVAARDGRFEDEGLRVRKDGSRFWANVVITALRNRDGTLVGFAKVTRDLTSRKEAEESLRALTAQAAVLAEKARIQEFQERFLAILGHDLRNPLASIDMGAGLLRQRTTDPKMIRVLDRMNTSSRRMSRMIEQILDLTRSRLGSGLELKPEAMDLCETLTVIVDELKTAHVSRIIELRCPPLLGTWDRDRLEQVFSNLVGNAILHGDSTLPVTIEGRPEGDAVVVEVHNRGEPIPEASQGTLFNPFRRGERESRTSKTEGLGLGLYISHEIVVAHGGKMDFRSNASEGTTFRVTLPRPKGDSPAPQGTSTP